MFLWWRASPGKLRPETTAAIASATDVFVSVASAWEIAIKSGLGRIEIPESVAAGVADSGFRGLRIEFAHVERVSDLPNHHRDPFDRLLAAQAQMEKLRLVTRDSKIVKYDLDILVA